VPEGVDGHSIIDFVAKQFENIGLLEDAAELLNRTLVDIGPGPAKTNRILDIANFYYQHKKFDSVGPLLDSIPLESVSLERKTEILSLKAKALFASDKAAQASALIESSTDPYQIVFLSTIHIERKLWKKVIDQLSSLLYRLDPKKEEDKKILVPLLNNLALAYVMDQTPDKDKANDKSKDKKTPSVAPAPAVPSAFIHQDKLDDLRVKYGALMKGQTKFEFYTRPVHTDMQNLAGAKDILADSDTVIKFAEELAQEKKGG
jgi:hypothetical protein